MAADIATVLGAFPGGTYVEPFMGSCAVLHRMTGTFERVYGYDAHPDLVLMWQAVQAGWEPPAVVTEEEYRQLRAAEPSALRGFVGFGCSFGGRWFQGYARNRRSDDYAGATRRSLLKRAPALRDVVFECADYTAAYAHARPGTVIYCDPPYAGTKVYSGAPAFDSAAFWAHAKEWTDLGATVLVSEYQAPPGWTSVWSREKAVTMRRGPEQRRVEHLWMLT